METFSPAGDEMMALVSELYPICRSITGNGVRATLDIVGRVVPLTVHEVPSGTQVLDWTVPDEWNVRDAYIADSSGTRLIDFTKSNLHVVSYSVPVAARMTLDDLRPHLHTLPGQPDLIPYRTSYYDRDWGFCLSQQQLDELMPDTYEVRIDSSLEPGHLTYGELIVPGRVPDEVLISTHVCHPSLCDDNLSGIAVSAMLARRLLEGPQPRYTLRFLYAPGTIGAITWLARNRDGVSRIRGGLTLSCLGDSQPFAYKRTVDGEQLIDRAVSVGLRDCSLQHDIIDFFPYGYDERQYNSPGFRLPIGALMRGRHGLFPEYHTSADNLDFVAPERLSESLGVLESIVTVIDRNRVFRNLEPYGEPQLGRRGLYRALGGSEIPDLQLAMLWVLNLGDGSHDLLSIAGRSGLTFDAIAAAADLLEEHGLLAEVASTS